MRDFNACILCLQTARDPLSCPWGHIACKECIYENILAQRKEIGRQKEKMEGLVELKKLEDQQEVDRETALRVEEFQRAQQLTSSAGSSASAVKVSGSSGDKKALNSFWLVRCLLVDRILINFNMYRLCFF